MPANLASTIYQRQYDAARMPNPSVPPEFVHTPADDKPTAPALPGVLTHDALRQFLVWKAHRGTVPTDPLALAKMIEWQAYEATPAFNAWQVADIAARRAQWRLTESDANQDNAGTTPASGDATGAGSSPPPAVVVIHSNTPEP